MAQPVWLSKPDRKTSTPVKAVLGSILALLVLGSGWILSGASADVISAGEARTLLQHLGGGDLKKNQIQIKKIGSGGIVDAQIETAFRFVRDGREWKATEIRLGDKQWESLELIDEGVKREKARRTSAALEKIAIGLDAYQAANGRFVVAEEYIKLLDELAPKYYGPIVYVDLWGTPLAYRGAEKGFKLSSAGADRLLNTADDLVLEKGTPPAATATAQR